MGSNNGLTTVHIAIYQCPLEQSRVEQSTLYTCTYPTLHLPTYILLYIYFTLHMHAHIYVCSRIYIYEYILYMYTYQVGQVLASRAHVLCLPGSKKLWLFLLFIYLFCLFSPCMRNAMRCDAMRAPPFPPMSRVRAWAWARLRLRLGLGLGLGSTVCSLQFAVAMAMAGLSGLPCLLACLLACLHTLNKYSVYIQISYPDARTIIYSRLAIIIYSSPSLCTFTTYVLKLYIPMCIKYSTQMGMEYIYTQSRVSTYLPNYLPSPRRALIGPLLERACEVSLLCFACSSQVRVSTLAPALALGGAVLHLQQVPAQFTSPHSLID